MKVKITQGCIVHGKPVNVGETVDVERMDALGLVSGNRGYIVPDAPQQTHDERADTAAAEAEARMKRRA